MLNLVEKFTPEAVEVTNEEGVVALEYVIVAGALVIALAALWTAFGGQPSGKMSEIIGNVGNGSTGS